MHGTQPSMAANRRRRRRRSNPAGYDYAPQGGLFSNPTYSGLFENPMGPYSMTSLKAFGVAAAGLAVGLTVARIADRWLATRTPAQSKGGNKANRPWYGKNAVAAISRRPDAIRIGAQVGGAVLGIGGAYALRHKPIAPWLLGGVALGFGSNALLQLMEWYVLPYFFKIQKADEQTLQNRLFVVEQIDTQDKVDAIFEDWQSTPALAQNQDQNAPTIMGPLNAPGSSDIMTVGRPGARANSLGAPRRFVPDGRVGHCATCGGDGGHYSGCDKCDTCNGGGGRKCVYTVQAGVDVYQVARDSGVDIATIAALNGGGTPEQWWKVGNDVTMPEAACNVVLRSAPSLPQQPVPVTSVSPLLPTGPMTNRTAPYAPPNIAGTPQTVSEQVAVNYALAGGE